MNNYDVEKIVGQGSYGKALLCRRKADKKRCIVKQISTQRMSAKEIKQTELESTLLSRLAHPNIVAFWESFSSGGCLNIVMEYADGGDLDRFIKNRRTKGPLAETQVLQYFVQISLALKHVHDRKILHRDLKSQVCDLVMLTLFTAVGVYNRLAL
jgi:NIMA (never in mitosis gene a)-related kinase 1/4/5